MSRLYYLFIVLLSIFIKSIHSSHQFIDETTQTSPSYSPPYDLEFVRINDTSVVVKWDINYSSHSQLQFFKLQYKSTRKDAAWKTAEREIPPNIKAYQVNGLKPGNYFFIVSAVYDNDDNLPSEQIKFKIRAQSKIPNSEMPEMKAPELFWSEAQVDYIRFKWKYTPKDHDVPYYGYLVYYRSAHVVSDFQIYNTLDENIEIVDLEQDTPYEVKVVAYNRVGVSNFSELISIKTKSNSTTVTKPPVTTPTITTSSVTTPTVTTSTVTPTTPKPITNFPVNVIGETTNRIMNKIGNSTSKELLSSWLGLIICSSLLVLLPILFFILYCFIICHRTKKHQGSVPPIDDRLEINEYFKNSFPVY